MTKTILYRQCRLTRRLSGRSHIETVSWLPERFARVGRTIKLRDSSRNWIDGWTVVSVGSVVKDEQSLPDYRRRIRNHREATGDSLT